MPTTSNPTVEFGDIERALEEAVESLRRVLLCEATLEGALEMVVGFCVGVIPGCDGAAVTLTEQGRVLATWASGDAIFGLVEHQTEEGGGPCVDATETDAPWRVEIEFGDVPSEGAVAVTSGRPTERLLPFAGWAAEAGFRSLYGVPLRLGPGLAGCLLLASRQAGLDADDERLGRDLAAQAGIMLGNVLAYERCHAHVDDLRSALATRDLIGQAKGVIMERNRCTATRAEEMLRIAASTHGVATAEMAERIVGDGAWTAQRS